MSTRLSDVSADDGGQGQYLPWAVDPDAVPADVRAVVLGARERAERRRVLAVIMYTDIIGSTQLAAALGDARYGDLLEAHNALVRRELVRFDGREVDTAGDGFVTTFESPSDAIACAGACIEAVRWIGIDIRAGVHAGECELVGGKPGGLAMNIGQRVMAEAQAGEVLVTSTVRELLAGSDRRFDELAGRELRGVPGLWRLYSVAA